MRAHNPNRWLRAVGATLLLAALGTAQAQMYKLNLPAEDDPDTVLQSITVSPQQTRVTVLLKNTDPGENYEVCVHPSGSPDVFTLKVLDTGEALPLTSSSGLSKCNVKRDVIRPGKRKTLQLTFPPLPAGTNHLQLGERDCQPHPDSDLINWCFKHIALPQR